ncbi:MAG: pyridoxal phosphate-dependent aminotransferase [Mogibacterium sp.]|nr:pyridoxal phosphate-dependent aminotransferase [Mogibacterium sp.]
MQYSPIRRFNPLAKAAEDKGMRVYKLNIGQPDIVTPECFIGAIRNYDQKVIAYQQSQGDANLVQSIIAYTERDYGVSYDEQDIIITMGASEALTMAFSVLLNKGDQVMIPEPFYTNYTTFIALAGGSVAPVPTSPADGYRYADRELLERHLTDATKAIACISPGNPTGNVLTDDDKEVIAAFAEDHDLWIIADEAYREYVFDGRKPSTFAQVEHIRDRLIVVDSVSKRFSACGARIGYAASTNREFMEGMLKIAQGRLCVPTVDQVGAAALFRLPASYYDEVRAEYEERRDAAYEEIMRIPGVVCRKPGGAFYMSMELPVEDAEDFLLYMLTEFNEENETVMFAPASGFYATPGSGRSEIRIAYVLNPADMRRACWLIRTGLERYKAR